MRRKGQRSSAPRKVFYPKKTCRFCADKIDNIDYKDIKALKGLLTERGKIIPSRISGNCSHHQRKATTAIKRARQMALLPFTVSR